MSRLTADEAWREIASAHTGILTTLRRDGMPIALSVWFVVEDRNGGQNSDLGQRAFLRSAAETNRLTLTLPNCLL